MTRNMSVKPNVLGIIPARGGSKSVPGKNIALVAGKPLIYYTIRAAKRSGFMDRIVVSTDSAEIRDVAKDLGAEVPFLRPPELARDDTPGVEPVLHMLEELAEREGYHCDYMMKLQPTSPLRTAEDIRGTMNVIKRTGAEAVVSVTPVSQHPLWMRKITPEGRLADFMEDSKAYVRRQDLPELYALNGATYLI